MNNTLLPYIPTKQKKGALFQSDKYIPCPEAKRAVRKITKICYYVSLAYQISIHINMHIMKKGNCVTSLKQFKVVMNKRTLLHVSIIYGYIDI